MKKYRDMDEFEKNIRKIDIGLYFGAFFLTATFIIMILRGLGVLPPL